MSNGIQDNSRNRSNQGQGGQQQQEQQDNQSHRTRRTGERERQPQQGLGAMAGLLSNRVYSRNTNTSLNDVAEAVLNTLSKLGSAYGIVYNTLPIQANDSPAVPVPLLVTVAECNGAHAYYVSVIETGTTRPEDRTNTEGNETYRVFVSSGEAITGELIKYVEERVSTWAKMDASKFIYAGASVYYRQNDPADVRAIENYAQLCVGLALATSLAIDEPDFRDLCLTDYTYNGEKLILRAEMPDQHDIDPAGIPLRNDIKMVLCVQAASDNSRNRDADQTPTYSSAEPLVAASMYTDTIYDPREVKVEGARRGQEEYLDTTYTPVVVITDLIAAKQTPNQLLLALAAAFGVRNKSTYMAALDPRAVSTEVAHLRNIGALQIDIGAEHDRDGQFGQGFDANDLDNYSQKDHLEFVRQNFNDEVMFALEVPEFGANTWYLEAFARAGEGDVQARKDLLDAADDLTNGAFSVLYRENGGTGKVVDVQEMRYVRGFYHNKNGMRRSNMDIDNVARFNILGDTSPAHARLAEEVEIDQNRSQYYRSAFLHKIVNSCQAIEPVGYSVRYYLESAFIVALSAAVVECGVCPELNSPYAESSTGRRTTGSRFASFSGIGRDVRVNIGEVRSTSGGRSSPFRNSFQRSRR